MSNPIKVLNKLTLYMYYIAFKIFNTAFSDLVPYTCDLCKNPTMYDIYFEFILTNE